MSICGLLVRYHIIQPRCWLTVSAQLPTLVLLNQILLLADIRIRELTTLSFRGAESPESWGNLSGAERAGGIMLSRRCTFRILPGV